MGLALGSLTQAAGLSYYVMRLNYNNLSAIAAARCRALAGPAEP